jgi:hypothetical protein
MMELDAILSQLERFGISTTNHSQVTLLSHLRGTYDILKKWQSADYVCLAGLCHSIYGTESFSRAPVTLDNREYVRELIGEQSERLAYLFGAHNKESLWKNLDSDGSIAIEDRFLDSNLPISKQDFSDLVTVTLANWLEQRPRVGSEFLMLRREEFLRSKPYLSTSAYQDFISAYGIKN